MCRQIIELHGGHITCGAGSGERGTRITVTLPALCMTENTGTRDASADVAVSPG
jgi:signal transduction histidine kinase